MNNWGTFFHSYMFFGTHRLAFCSLIFRSGIAGLWCMRMFIFSRQDKAQEFFKAGVAIGISEAIQGLG